MTNPGPSRWLISSGIGSARHRLYCLSYAGGSAQSFASWQQALPDVDVCAVQLPGRGARFNEPPYSSIDALLPALANAIASDSSTAFSLFGHSLGGVVAFELARHLRRHGRPMPRLLIVSGSDAPSCRKAEARFACMSDEEFLVALGSFNGIPGEILENKSLMALLLPTIRADFAMLDTYAYRIEDPLDVPIDVLCGSSDPHVDIESMERWRGETSSTCRVHRFNGDHFFIHSDRVRVLELIGSRIRAI